MKNKTLELLKKSHAIFTDDHFVYTSGKHGRVYVNKDALYPHTEYVSHIGKIIAKKYKDSQIDVVVGPALGGIILSQWTANHLSKLLKKEILGIYTEKMPDRNQIFTRGYGALIANKNVLIVEDIVTTGGSIEKVINSIQEGGGNVIASCAMVNKDPKHVGSKIMGIPFDFLAMVDIDVFDAANCPMCQENIPVNITLGHGRKFLEEKEKSTI
jgi:orotate phosphoribosyltransferase